MKVAYPKHNHPHGPENTPPNNARIWVCEECAYIFTDAEIKADLTTGKWGHACKNCSKGYRCESHLEPYVPDIVAVVKEPDKKKLLEDLTSGIKIEGASLKVDRRKLEIK